MTPTAEEVEAALSRADMPIHDGLGPSWTADAKALKAIASAYRQIRDSQPRTWSAGDIGSAPEGLYISTYPDGHHEISSRSGAEYAVKFEQAIPLGPLPTAPVAAVTDGGGAHA